MNPFEKDWTSDAVAKAADVAVAVSPAKKCPVSSHADITILLDKSGSMETMYNDIIGGYNEVLKQMRKDNPGENRWSMYHFDDPDTAAMAKEAFPQPIFEQKLESELEPLTRDNFVPRGWTALVDAYCKTILSIDARTSGQDHIKPIVMVMTDGGENGSREFSSDQLRKMITERQERGWNFLYYGANQDSFAVTNQYNASGGAIASCSSLSRGSTYANNFTGGMASGAVGSGMIGCFHLASGAVATSVLP